MPCTRWEKARVKVGAGRRACRLGALPAARWAGGNTQVQALCRRAAVRQAPRCTLPQAGCTSAPTNPQPYTPAPQPPSCACLLHRAGLVGLAVGAAYALHVDATLPPLEHLANKGVGVGHALGRGGRSRQRWVAGQSGGGRRDGAGAREAGRGWRGRGRASLLGWRRLLLAWQRRCYKEGARLWCRCPSPSRPPARG